MTLTDRQRRLRLAALELIHEQGEGHSGRVLSCIDLLEGLYFGQEMEHPLFQCDPTVPQWEGRDLFVLSKYEAAPALYVTLKEAGFQLPADLPVYPDHKIPGVDATVTRQAYGLGLAVGMASALQLQRRHQRVFCLMGEYELERGQAWEAVMTAARLQLDNLCVIVDENDPQENPIQEKFEAFGWKVIKLLNAHDPEEIVYAYVRARSTIRKPVCIWAPTVKSKGVPFAEMKADYDDVAYSDAELLEARKILL